MIPQLGFAEMLVIAVLALIVVGPKDLPKMMRTVGQFVARIKAMGQEFKDAFNLIGEDEDLAELRKEIDELKAMGQMSNLSDEAFEEDMRALDKDLGKAVSTKPDINSSTSSETKTDKGVDDDN